MNWKYCTELILMYNIMFATEAFCGDNITKNLQQIWMQCSVNEMAICLHAYPNKPEKCTDIGISKCIDDENAIHQRLISLDDGMMTQEIWDGLKKDFRDKLAAVARRISAEEIKP